MKLFKSQSRSSTGMTSRCEAVATDRQPRRRSQLGQANAASLKLASVMESTDPLTTKPAVLYEFADRFLNWVRMADWKRKPRSSTVMAGGCAKSTSVAGLRVDQITGDSAEQLKFPGSAANANCALRTLRRMLHKAEEWKVIGHAPKIKMMKEHGRHLRLDEEAERKLIMGALACNWRQ